MVNKFETEQRGVTDLIGLISMFNEYSVDVKVKYDAVNTLI